MERDSQEIRLCALVLSVVAFFLFIAAEIVHEQRSAPSRGVLLLVAIGALAFAWIGPLTLLAGTLRSRKFQWWQPFQGGAEFVWMQAYGWCFHTFVLTGCVVVLANPQVPKWFEGQYLLLGAMGFMAQILLNLSIGCFRDVAGAELPTFEFPFTTKAVVSLLVSASGTLMFICYDLFSHRGQSPVMVALGCLEFIISALVIHVLYGCADIPGFRIWQPFEGERTFLLLQYLGWQLFAFTVGGALSIFFRAVEDPSVGSSRGSGTAIGAMGMTSQLLLLASLQYFDGSSIKPGSDGESNSIGDTVQCSADRDVNERSVRDAKKRHPNRGRKWRHPAEIYVASLLCIGALGVGCASYVCASRRTVVPEPLLHFFLTHEKVGWIISLSSLAIAAPIANMGGVRAKPGYCWWQPFQGGTKFVFLQTLGWLWYGFYIAFAIVLCMNSASCGDLAAGLVLVVGSGSAGAIATSLAYFESPPSASTSLCATRPVHWCDAIKGEVTMVLLLALSSTLIHCGVDYFQMQLPPSLRAYCLTLAMALFVLASTISHWTGRKRSPQFRMWQPFEGGDRFVIRQAVGWALFGVQLLFDSLQLTLVPQTVPFGALSLLGAFALMPTLLLLSSLQYFEPSATRDKRRHDRACGDEQSPSHARTQCRDWSALMQDASLRWHMWSNVLVMLGSTCLFIAAETLGTAKSSYQRAEEVLYLFGCLLSTFGIAFTHGILGPKVHATYRVFQPFRGGIQFITFHGAAWTLVAVAWALSTTVIYWSALFFEIPGIHLLTGLLYTASQSILLYSVPLFKPTDERRATQASAQQQHQQQQHLKADEELANQFFVGRLLGFSACAVFVLVDLAIVRWGPSIPVFPMSVSAVLALFSSIPMSYKFASSHYGSKAKTLSGSIVFVVLGCALWSFTLLLGGLFSYNLWRTQNISLSVSSVPAPTQYLGSFTGSVGFTAQLLFFQASEPPQLKDEFGITLPREEKLAAIASAAKKHLAVASIWVYSSVPLVAGLLYAHTKSVLPKHVATSQILVLTLCSAAVIGVAWWIQQQIVSTGCVGLPLRSSATLPRALPRTLAASESLAPNTAVVDIGADCYAHIAAFLTVSELLVVSSTSKALHALHSERFWRQLFIERFFPSVAQQPQQHQEISSSIRTKAVSHGAVTIRVGTRPFAATTLNRVESAVVNAICRLEIMPNDSPPKRASVNMQSKWKAFCVGGERRFAFEHCRVCDEIDAVSESLLRYERRERCSTRAPTTWVTLCDCVNPVTLRREKAHRMCLERKLLQPTRHRTSRDAPGDSTNIARHVAEVLPPPLALEMCQVCDTAVVEDARLPRTLRELVEVTIADFRSARDDFGGGFFVLVPASASIFIVALHRVGWGSCAMYVWVVTIVALCFIINSPRFDRCLARLGRPDSPSFVAYQRAYQALALSSIVHLSWCCPSMNQFESVPTPTLAQRAVKLAFRCNCVCFVALAAAACLAFWRTQYRVATVSTASRDAGNSAPSLPAVAGVATTDVATDRNRDGATAAAAISNVQDESCVLCLLKLCDDTHE